MTEPRASAFDLRAGIQLMTRTLGQYRRLTVLSIIGALLWMAMTVAVPFVNKTVIDNSIAADEPDLLPPLIAILIAVGLLKALGIAGRRFFAFQFSFRAEADLRHRIFEHIQRLEFAYHDLVPTGELMSRASSDLGQVRLIFAMLPITVANFGLFIAVAGVMLFLDPVLGVVAVVSVPGLLLLARRYAQRVLAASFDVQQRLADMSSVVEEAVAGIRVVKSYGQEEQETQRVAATAEGIYTRTVDLLRQRSTYVPLFEALPAIAGAVILAVGGVRVIRGQMTFGEFVAFTEYMVILNFPLRITGWFMAELPRASAASTRIVELLDEAPNIVDPVTPVELPSGGGHLVFDNVGFSYPDGPPVLDGLDLEIPAGTSVALVGATASGKTTLAYLLPRYYDVTSGEIRVDGVDIRTLAVSDLRESVSVVFEDSFLFSRSIRDNIAFGCPDATDQEILAASALARADGFISELDDGYDTIVGERGYSLSGGQRQRISLARAVLRSPRVLILDDATSSVDAVTEEEIRVALRQVMDKRTTIIIAHRPSTLQLADRVVFIDEGRVAATGTHEALLASNERYREVLADTMAATS